METETVGQPTTIPAFCHSVKISKESQGLGAPETTGLCDTHLGGLPVSELYSDDKLFVT